MPHSPVVWSIAGTDSGGGAGLSADQRAADAMGVHLCPVVAVITAQSTVAVTRVDAVSPDLLDAQLTALATDMPPAAIKTGLLGSVANVRVVAAWIDRLRRDAPVALVVDPVFGASTGASFAGAELRAAYRDLLLPRATAVTPNRREAGALLDRPEPSTADLPAFAAALQALGPATVCITGGDADDAPTLAVDWLASPQAAGWLALPRRQVPYPHGTHGTGCTFATAVAAALARGFPQADAAILAKMLTTGALADCPSPGRGAGPARPRADFIVDPALLPRLTHGAEPPNAWAAPSAPPPEPPGLYAIVDHADRAAALFEAGIRTVQLRIKRPEDASSSDTPPGKAWRDHLHAQIRQARAAADSAGAILYVNDHWQAALELGVHAVHLGQEDLLALTPAQHRQIAEAQARGLRLGLSTHSLWELCRAAAHHPAYIACGPVWPTLTKAMPWIPQGLDNLAWWVRMAPVPVVGIGGILEPAQLQAVAALGAGGGCVVRGLEAAAAHAPAEWIEAWARGWARQPEGAPRRTRSLLAVDWPHASLPAA